MVASGVAYVASTLAFTHRMHRTHLDALRLGYENLALLEQVRREKEAAERSNLENRASWPPPAMTCASPCSRSACSWAC